MEGYMTLLLLHLIELVIFGGGVLAMHRKEPKLLAGVGLVQMLGALALLGVFNIVGQYSLAAICTLAPWFVRFSIYLVENSAHQAEEPLPKNSLTVRIRVLSVQESNARAKADKLGRELAELEEQYRAEVGDGYRAPALPAHSITLPDRPIKIRG
jgi:hypothetical protein